MKSTILFLSAFLSLSVNAQYSFQLLEGNNVSATINNSGSQFTTVNESAGYLVPQNANAGLIFSAQFWYAGVDEEGTLRAALGGNFNESDVFIGPYSDDYSDLSYSQEFAQSIYSFCSSEIQYFVKWWECQNGILTEGCDDLENPTIDFLERIYSYPAHGNVAIGQDYWLLPFWDRDGDGVYNPDNGDFPIIKGCCGTYLIQNDTRNLHSSGALTIGMQMVYHFYQYSNGGLLDDFTFIDVQAVNKGEYNFQEFRFGLMVDGDIGFPYDDFMGSDPVRQMAFFYNADNFDEDDEDIELYGFGDDPPAIGIVALKTELNSIISPSTSFNSVMSKWMNLGGLQESGQPFLDPDDVATSFMYSGALDNSNEWSELNSGNVSGDRRLLMSSIINNFQSGDTISQTYAIIYSRSGNNVQNALSLGSIADAVKEFYLEGEFYNCESLSAGTHGNEEILFEVFPNPSSGIIQISSQTMMDEFSIRDLNGREVLAASVDQLNQVEIDLSNVMKGVYTLTISSNKGTSTRRIMKF